MHPATRCPGLPEDERGIGEAEATDRIMEWANECLRDALQFGPVATVPLYKLALEHAASVKFGQQMKVALAKRSRLDRGRSMLPPAFVVTTLEGRLPAAA